MKADIHSQPEKDGKPVIWLDEDQKLHRSCGVETDGVVCVFRLVPIAVAKRLLKSGKYPIHDIARAKGPEDRCYF